jgi:uncharacterized protein (TIGR03435 family)
MFGQTADNSPYFDAVDVHNSPSGAIPYMRGGYYRGGRLELRSAEMLDLIYFAYGVEFDKVVGGPNWIESDRFDVIASAPVDATLATKRLMFQNLLAERFSLVVKNDRRDLPTYALTTDKQTRLEQADGSGDTGCKVGFQSGAGGRGGQSAGPAELPVLTFTYTCRNMTMPAFAEQVRSVIGRAANPILDETGLNGAWNFSFTYSFQGPTGAPALMNALDKQVGLKLEPRKIAMPVLVVESVNRKPTPNPPDMEKKIPAGPSEFEVVDVKPSDPTSQGPQRGSATQPGGRVSMRGVTLKYLILFAFNTTPGEVSGGPKFLDTEKFDIIGKLPDGALMDPSARQILTY